MIMENQVLSIEQMQELIALGVDTSKSGCYWYIYGDEKTVLVRQALTVMCSEFDSHQEKRVPTFTLYDILNMLPKSIVDDDDRYYISINEGRNHNWMITYSNYTKGAKVFVNTSLLQVAFEALIYSIKFNNYSR